MFARAIVFFSIVFSITFYSSVLRADYPLARFKAVAPEDLASLGTISAIVQDQYGFVWFGGQSGLARYDGYELHVYETDQSNPNTISSNLVWDIHEDSRGDLWIATAWGLNRFDHEKQRFHRYMHDPHDARSISNNAVKTIIESRDGRLWIGTEGGGLNVFDWTTQTFKRFHAEPASATSLHDNVVLSLLEDKVGDIWVGTSRGLHRYQPNDDIFTPYYFQDDELKDYRFDVLLSIYEDRSGEIYIGTLAGLCRLDRDNNVYRVFENTFSSPVLSKERVLGGHGVWDIVEDKDGLLWIATDRQGVIALSPKRDDIHVYVNDTAVPGSIRGNVVRVLMEDLSGDMWFGTFPMGIDFLDRSSKGVVVIDHQPNKKHTLSHRSVLTIEETRSGDIWLGTEAGLDLYDRKTEQFKHYVHDPKNPNSLSASTVMAIAEDDKGYLWIGTWGGGVNVFNPKTENFSILFNDLEANTPISAKYIANIMIDHQQHIWFGTFTGGLLRYKPEKSELTRFLHDSNDEYSLSHNIVRVVYEDRQKKVWVGTRNGLAQFQDTSSTFRHVPLRLGQHNTQPGEEVLSIFEDSQDRLWVGRRTGVSVLDKRRHVIKEYSKQSGLPNEIIRSITEDSEGSIWLGTDSMLVRISQNDDIDRFDKNNWLQGRYNIGAVEKLSSGHLAFGNMNGLMLFTPRDLKPNTYSPPVVLTGFEVFNQAIMVGDDDSVLSKAVYLEDSITLDYRQSVFSVTFAALNYRNTKKNQYAYRLQGFDNDWHQVGHRRRATYTNLDPGTYVFQVKGSNDEGVWNDEGTSLTVIVQPPLWMTKEAYVAYVVLLLSIIALCVFVYKRRELKRKEEEEKSWNQANFDFLTGLPNRMMFHNRLEHEIMQSKRTGNRIALLSLDLDRFKEVNDTLGHAYGDILLCQVADRLRSCVRDIDTIARLGGDEFIIIIGQLQEATCVERIASDILNLLSQPFHLKLETAYVSTSIGITFYPDDAEDITTLLTNVDQAMYAAKENGRDCFQYFTPSMQHEALARTAMINDLRVALPNNQFHLVYQPIVDLFTGRIHKAEALIRWRHPYRDLVNPGEFILLAEETGMINEIGQWVFMEATRQVSEWRERIDPGFQVSINMSPKQYQGQATNLSAWIGHLSSLNLPGEALVVEITEGLLMENQGDVLERMLTLRDAGIQVALDDFGTGYSSLSYLKKFDIDFIKIDRSFVSNLSIDSNDFALCQAIIVMAHKLGLKVVAEGIETTHQRNLLMAAGCDFGQGYLYAKPLSPSNLESLAYEANQVRHLGPVDQKNKGISAG